jgi:hypothetical protein
VSKYRKQQGSNPFDNPQEADNTIFSGGEPQGIVDLRVVAKPTELTEIWADVKQPRRAIPASIRLSWNGDPAKVKDLLTAWEMAAYEKGLKITPGDIIRGSGEGVETDGLHPIAAGYLELLRLAQDIKRVGLTNPISIVKQGGRFVIESGERRYLAYWLLFLLDGDSWQKIPAITSDGKDFVWKQASENTIRRALNAIGMARQLALLIMDARTGLDGQTYDRYEDMVLPGQSDRRFYAQVANGNIHRIPKGFGERVQTAMGLSMTQLSRYRNLLKLTPDDVVNDALWIRADVEDWAEGALREIADTLPIGKVREVIEREDWTLDDLRKLIPAPTPQTPLPGFGLDKTEVPPGDERPAAGTVATGTLPTGEVGTSPTGDISYATDPTNYPALDLVNAVSGGVGRLPERKAVWAMVTGGEYKPLSGATVSADTLVTVKGRFTQTLRGRKDDLVTVRLPGGTEVIVSANPDVNNPPDPRKTTPTGDIDRSMIYRELSTCVAGTRLLLISEHRVWEMTVRNAYQPTDEVLFPGTPMTVQSWFVQKTDEGEVDLVIVELAAGRRVVLAETPAWKQRPTITDKADSVTPEEDEQTDPDVDAIDETNIPDDLMLNIEGPEYQMMAALLDITDAYNDDKTRRAIMSVMLLSFGEAKKLATNGTLHNQLNEYYQVIERAAQEWLSRISDFFMWVEENS